MRNAWLRKRLLSDAMPQGKPSAGATRLAVPRACARVRARGPFRPLLRMKTHPSGRFGCSRALWPMAGAVHKDPSTTLCRWRRTYRQSRATGELSSPPAVPRPRPPCAPPPPPSRPGPCARPSRPPPPPPGPAPVRGPQAQHQEPMSWCGWWGSTAHVMTGGHAR